MRINKNWSVVLAVCVSCLTITTPVMSQTPTTPSSGGSSGGSGSSVSAESPVMPIVSEEMLDIYALSLVKNVDVQMWENNARLGSFYTSLQYTGAVGDAQALIDLPNSVVPKIELVSTNNWVTYYVGYNGRVGSINTWGLFYGYSSKKAVLGKGGYVLPTFGVQLVRSDYVPWPKKGLQNASMTIRDENGNASYYNFRWDDRLDSENGILYLGSKHVNRSGELYLSYEEDGKYKTDVIDLSTGNIIQPSTITSAGASVAFSRLNVLPVNSSEIIHQLGSGDKRAYYAAYTQVTDVKISYSGESETPVAIYMIEPETLAIDPEAWVPLEPDTYRIEAGRKLYLRFDYGLPNPNPIPVPDDDGGKG